MTEDGDVQFWCSASTEPWSWTPTPYVGVWLVMALLVGWYVRAWRRKRPDRPLTDVERRQPWWFALGALMLWVATDWPVGALGAGYLASVHMLQFMIYTLGAAPLLLMGLPEWFFERARQQRWWGAVRQLSRPIVAGLLFNVVLLSTHAPIVVDTLRVSQVGSFFMDVVWVLSGLILWLPLLNPDASLRHRSMAVRAAYLFLASGALPMLPGAFLVFAPGPLYRVFELAPPVFDISAANDQQMAGLLMKVGNIPILWPVLLVLFVRWSRADAAATPPPRPPAGLVEASAIAAASAGSNPAGAGSPNGAVTSNGAATPGDPPATGGPPTVGDAVGTR
jgi:cytochrome c oxidase assembly factor CtaG